MFLFKGIVEVAVVDIPNISNSILEMKRSSNKFNDEVVSANFSVVSASNLYKTSEKVRWATEQVGRKD